jgi:hypothetical protein
MKKYTLHLDAVIVVGLLFVLCIGANIFQRKLHGDLHKKNIALISELTNTQLELIDSKVLFKECDSKDDDH